MKYAIAWFACLITCLVSLAASSPPSPRLFIPLMDHQSQSNVTVFVSEVTKGEICPDYLTNLVTNTKFFPSNLQSEIPAAFFKYQSVTPTNGPVGTVLVSSVKTNNQYEVFGRKVVVDSILSTFKYTNHHGQEVIRFGGGLFAEYRDVSSNGYDVSFNRTGAGTELGFGEIKDNKLNGIFARFEDRHSQGMNWSHQNAEFVGSGLSEYRQYSNGFVFGKYLMWRVNNGNLLIQAEFTVPYDWNKNFRMPP